MVRRLAREKVERIVLSWRTRERKIERELALLKSTARSDDTIVYDGTVLNQRLLDALGRRLHRQGLRVRCWSDPDRNEFRAWVEPIEGE